MGQFLNLHESPELFRQALGFTAAQSGFAQRLIEKDYFCSLVLADFEPLFEHDLVFKGGTSLSKVHTDFYRLSEDLDFAFSIPTDARRSGRRKAVAPVKLHLAGISDRLPVILAKEQLRGHDDSRQYNATLTYESLVTGEHEALKIQFAVREPVIDTPISCIGRTLLAKPLPQTADGQGPKLKALSLRETYAEKLRAAFTRTPPAIRDIYDIDDAMQKNRLDFRAAGFLELIRKKLAVPRNSPVDLGDAWKSVLRIQRNSTELKAVLRHSDFEAFDLERAFAHIESIKARLQI
jgi:predicted nucleotidyltransferase component of viral defense system